MRGILLLLIILLIAPPHAHGQWAEARPTLGGAEAPGDSLLVTERIWAPTSPLSDPVSEARARGLSPIAKGALIGGGVGASVGVISFTVQDGWNNPFAPPLFLYVVAANAALGAVTGALIGWITS